MIIKCTTIDASHGHNAIQYAMVKDKNRKDEPKPEFLACNHIPYDDITLDPPSPTDVWNLMKIRQAHSGHKISEPFFRFEISPPMEECQDWSHEDFEKCLRDAIRHLNQNHVSPDGRFRGRAFDLDNCQWVATIHRDTDHWHIHMIANVITEDNRVQNTTQYKVSAIMAANAMAEERGWMKADKRVNKRKERIHKDALEVLKEMKKFDLQEYFRAMEAKGWIVDARFSNDICRGYSIGEKLYKPNGALSSTVLYQASKLGYGRDLMVSKIEGTWKRLHRNEVDRSKVRENPVKAAPAYVYEPKPQWQCSEHISCEDWRNGKNSFVRIPDFAFNILDGNVEDINPKNFYEKDSEIPLRADILAVAVYEFIAAATDYQESHSGGGGHKNDFRWDGLTEDDLREMAKRAAGLARTMCMKGLHKRGGLRR